MHSIIISILDYGLQKVIGEEQLVFVESDADFLDAIAALDKRYMKCSIKARRGHTTIHSILQLVWNPVESMIYEDIGIEARDTLQEWLPVRNDPFMVLPDGSSILITPDPGC